MLDKLRQKLTGQVKTNQESRDKYSHDTSLFEVVPQAVVFPQDVEDLKSLVQFVRKHKKEHPELSITARSGGTDMTGGAINDSLIVVFDKHFTKLGEVKNQRITAQPGVYYRDFDKKTKQAGLLMPAYPASREICAIGGMVNNNAGGEMSLQYGKTEDYVKRLKVVLADGNEYELKPLDKKALDQKMEQDDFEGQIYREVFQLIQDNYEVIEAAKPDVSKNSTGYKIWDVWDQETGVFDLTQLFVGSQGTLGLTTEAEFELVEDKPYSGLLVGYMESLEHLPEVISIIRRHNPTSFEAFDDYTFKFALRFFPSFRKNLGWWRWIKLAFSFIPDAWILATHGIPKLMILVEYEGVTTEEVRQKLDHLKEELAPHEKIVLEEAETRAKSKRFWLMRRESFNLLRENVKNKHTAPFIDDLVVPLSELEEFLPKLREIIDKYDLLATIAGHMGDGNFHVIPLMDLSKQSARDKIEPCLKEVIALIDEHNGVMSGEHNDGMIRGPFLGEIYSEEVIDIFKRVKEIFDPDNIFNPHKKTDADWQFSKDHIRTEF